MDSPDPNRTFSKWFFTGLTILCLGLGVDRLGGQVRFRPPALVGVALFAPIAGLFCWLDRGRKRADPTDMHEPTQTNNTSTDVHR